MYFYRQHTQSADHRPDVVLQYVFHVRPENELVHQLGGNGPVKRVRRERNPDRTARRKLPLTITNNYEFIIYQYGPRYDWSVFEQSILLGAYFYGYAIASIPHGLLVDKFGYTKATIGWAFIISIAMTIAAPLSVDTYALLVVLRFIMGFVSVCTVEFVSVS